MILQVHKIPEKPLRFDIRCARALPYQIHVAGTEDGCMDLAFGLKMTFWCMGITLFTLGLLILIIKLMNKIFPYKSEDEKKD